MNLLIALPCSHDSVPTGFAVSLGEMEKPLNCEVRHFGGYSVEMMRNNIAAYFLNERKGEPNFTDLLMLDIDMVYPRNTAIALFRRNKDLVAGLSSAKWVDDVGPEGEKRQVWKFWFYDEQTRDDDPYAVRCSGNIPTSGCHQVKALPGAGILIKRRVMEALPKPPFRFDFVSSSECRVGEDIFATVTARTLGFELWQDCDLKFGHIANLAAFPEVSETGKWKVVQRLIRT